MTDLEICTILKALPHKTGVNSMDWSSVHKDLLTIAMSCVEICQERRIPILFTSIIRPKIAGVSTTDIHAKGRAFDMSIHGMTTDDLDELLAEVNRRHAIAIGTGPRGSTNPRALIYEHQAGTGLKTSINAYEKINQSSPHLHGQCRK